jgi:sugar/nucleoside kinase (ribokinase family)
MTLVYLLNQLQTDRLTDRWPFVPGLLARKDFKYLTPRRRLEPVDVPSSAKSATHLHFVCSPTRAIEIHSQLAAASPAAAAFAALDTDSNDVSWRPTLVYEPIPDRCVPEELASLRQVLPHIAVFSPNHEEAHAFYGTSAADANARGRPGIEQVALRFFQEGAPDLVVIRSGALGAYAIRRGQSRGTWTEAFHRYGSPKVKDPTGAGNAFMVRGPGQGLFQSWGFRAESGLCCPGHSTLF